jgi:hypothetical protein
MFGARLVAAAGSAQKLFALGSLQSLKTLGRPGHEQDDQDYHGSDEKRKDECSGKSHAALTAANSYEDAERDV